MSSEQKRALYAEIAQSAGVSISTVSRVLNNRDLVRPETCNRVFAAMEGFGYNTIELTTRPQSVGGGLIVLNLPSLENPFYSEIVKGAKAAALRHGYKLVINVEHINQETFPGCLELLKKIKAAGLITLNHIPTKLLVQLQGAIPLVQCCEYDEGTDISFVSINDISTAKLAMKHILATGMRKVALINGPIRYKYARHRMEGYLSALREASIELENNWIIQLPEIDYSMAVSAITRLLTPPDPPNALFAVSDVFAAAAVRAAANCGLSIPRDLVVMGFDNVDISSTTSPTITTVNQPKFQLGFTACELLVEKMTYPDTPKREIYLDTELIVRESTTSAS